VKFLQIGLGSMGKRRIRCLKVLGYKDIIGFDLRRDRRQEGERLYGVKTISDLKHFDFSSIDAFIVSVPPDIHLDYIKMAVKENKPAFIEASVILAGLEKINILAKRKNILLAPSCTLFFHPAIKKIKNILQSKKYGKFTNFSYHSGQYLPDWHPWEKVKDYYVSKRETGGAREIVPFELTWIVGLLGYPEDVSGYFGKTLNLGVDINDTYVISLKFKQGFGSLLVDVVSRYAVRSLILNMEKGQIMWRWDEPVVKLYEAKNKKWRVYHLTKGQAAAGYNQNIIEEMYIDELKAFIKAILKKEKFPNSLDSDIKVLKILNLFEKNAKHQ